MRVQTRILLSHSRRFATISCQDFRALEELAEVVLLRYIPAYAAQLIEPSSLYTIFYFPISLISSCHALFNFRFQSAFVRRHVESSYLWERILVSDLAATIFLTIPIAIIFCHLIAGSLHVSGKYGGVFLRKEL